MEWQQVGNTILVPGKGDFLPAKLSSIPPPHPNPDLKKVPSNANLPGPWILLRKEAFSFRFIPLGKRNKHHLMSIKGLQGETLYTMTIFDSPCFFPGQS